MTRISARAICMITSASIAMDQPTLTVRDTTVRLSGSRTTRGQASSSATSSSLSGHISRPSYAGS